MKQSLRVIIISFQTVGLCRRGKLEEIKESDGEKEDTIALVLSRRLGFLNYGPSEGRM